MYELIVNNSNEIPNIIKTIDGFSHIHDNKIYFNLSEKVIQNIDAVSVMLRVQELLKTKSYNLKKENCPHPSKFYEEMMAHILEVGQAYSSFVEMLFANMFICDKEEDEFWRYNQDKQIVKKLGNKNMAHKIDTMLGILFQPNERTLNKFRKGSTSENDDLNIYTKIYLGKI